MSEMRLPRDWPARVPPPGAPGGDRQLLAWLWDQVPGEWREYSDYRRHPLMLARDAWYLTKGALESLQKARSRARVELQGQLYPEEVEARALEEYMRAHQIEAVTVVLKARQVRERAEGP